MNSMKVIKEIDARGICMGSRIMGFRSRGVGLGHHEDRCSRSLESLISCLDMDLSSDEPILSQKETEATGTSATQICPRPVSLVYVLSECLSARSTSKSWMK